jgi:hypothetical protein
MKLSRNKGVNLFFTSLLCILLSAFFSPVSAQNISGASTWSNPILVPTQGQADPKNPAIAVDSRGFIHLIWVDTTRESLSKYSYSIQYSLWTGSGWSLVNDITPASQNMQMPQLAVDNQDRLDLLFTGSPQYNLLFTQAMSFGSYSAKSWSEPYGIGEADSSIHSDIAVQQDHVHIIYEDAGSPDSTCPTCTGIYYRVSPDYGKTWSTPMLLFSSDLNSAWPNIQADAQGYIYAVWNEGVDPLLGSTGKTNGVFEILKPHAKRWSAPLKIDYPNQANIQMTVGVDGKGEVLLVWRTASTDTPGIYYMVSHDYGDTWDTPQAIPGIIAGPIPKGLDHFSIATDGNGHIHLLAVGYPNENASIITPVTATGTPEPEAPGLYHIEWDGQQWSIPQVVYRGGWFPMGPRLIINAGNHLYATWYVQDRLIEPDKPSQIFISSGTSSASFQTSVVIPTSTLVGTPTMLLTPRGTQAPVSSSTIDTTPPRVGLDAIYSEKNTYLTILMSLIPVFAFIILTLWISHRKK